MSARGGDPVEPRPLLRIAWAAGAVGDASVMSFLGPWSWPEVTPWPMRSLSSFDVWCRASAGSMHRAMAIGQSEEHHLYHAGVGVVGKGLGHAR